VYGTLGAAETRATDGKGSGAFPVMTQIRTMMIKLNALVTHPRNGYSSLAICISELDYCWQDCRQWVKMVMKRE
jgi:hypothetical protein